jgi:hypothetical protein
MYKSFVNVLKIISIFSLKNVLLCKKKLKNCVKYHATVIIYYAFTILLVKAWHCFKSNQIKLVCNSWNVCVCFGGGEGGLYVMDGQIFVCKKFVGYYYYLPNMCEMLGM